MSRLLPGEYYAVAIDDAAPEDLVDPMFLEHVSELGVKFRLGEGEVRSLQLRRARLRVPAH